MNGSITRLNQCKECRLLSWESFSPKSILCNYWNINDQEVVHQTLSVLYDMPFSGAGNYMQVCHFEAGLVQFFSTLSEFDVWSETGAALRLQTARVHSQGRWRLGCYYRGSMRTQESCLCKCERLGNCSKQCLGTFLPFFFIRSRKWRKYKL